MNARRINDEEAAMFSASISDGEVFELAGVTVTIGEHPEQGLSVVVSPSMGSHLIIAYPFAGNDALS